MSSLLLPFKIPCVLPIALLLVYCRRLTFLSGPSEGVTYHLSGSSGLSARHFAMRALNQSLLPSSVVAIRRPTRDPCQSRPPERHCNFSNFASLVRARPLDTKSLAGRSWAYPRAAAPASRRGWLSDAISCPVRSVNSRRSEVSGVGRRLRLSVD